MPEKPFVNLNNARLEEQRKIMEQILAQGVCPFCSEHLRKFHTQPILKETSHWILTNNQWPYKNTKVHLLAIYKIHAESLSEINPEAGAEVFELIRWAEQKYTIKGGGLGMRFGDPMYNGGTVRHLHAQILAADIADKKHPDYKPVRFKVG